MKKLFALILALSFLIGPAALADADECIAVQGRATVQAEPDIAVITLGATEKNASVTEAQSLVNQRISAIIQALTEDMKIEKSDIATDSYSIYADYSYNYDTNEQVLTGYVASCLLRITVRDIDGAGAVIDAAFAAGANQLSGVSFALEDSAALEDKALELAVQDGIHRAQVIAKAAGVRLPALPSLISEGGGVSYSASPAVYSMNDMAAMGTQLMAGTVEITATVSVSYDIKD